MNWNGNNLWTKVSKNMSKQTNLQLLICSLIYFEIRFVRHPALLLFGVQITEQSTVYLSDNTGTDIPQNLFLHIIKHFWNGSNFYVEIKYTPTINSNNQLVTPEVRKLFLIVV